jgi:plastocyanin domain-containing protein
MTIERAGKITPHSRGHRRAASFAAAALLLSAAALAGCSSSNTGTQEVAIYVTEDGFVPAKASVPRGVPVTLVVTRQTDQTCATSFRIPSLDRTVDLPLNQHVRIDLPGGIQDTLQYTCGMEMLHGMVIGK